MASTWTQKLINIKSVTANDDINAGVAVTVSGEIASPASVIIGVAYEYAKKNDTIGLAGHGSIVQVKNVTESSISVGSPVSFTSVSGVGTGVKASESGEYIHGVALTNIPAGGNGWIEVVEPSVAKA